MEIAVTGANGFIGSSLMEKLEAEGFTVRGLARNISDLCRHKKNFIQMPDLGKEFKGDLDLYGVSVIIHTAALVHVSERIVNNTQENFYNINVSGTINLAHQAIRNGVKQFIFISSIKVNGEKTEPDRPFTAEDVPIPNCTYGISKYIAEKELLKLKDYFPWGVTIIRPPLVYGINAKGNLATLLKWISRRIPLPLEGIEYNRRSLVSLDNLNDLIITCINNSSASNEVFLVSDNRDFSTTELLRFLGNALGIPLYLFRLPKSWLFFFAHLIRKPEIAERLCGSLCVDISKTKEVLGWEPKVSPSISLTKEAKDFKEKLYYVE